MREPLPGAVKRSMEDDPEHKAVVPSCDGEQMTGASKLLARRHPGWSARLNDRITARGSSKHTSRPRQRRTERSCAPPSRIGWLLRLRGWAASVGSPAVTQSCWDEGCGSTVPGDYRRGVTDGHPQSFRSQLGIRNCSSGAVTISSTWRAFTPNSRAAPTKTYGVLRPLRLVVLHGKVLRYLAC
jgi:hypothetical protein